ncbi:MAG: hypothetical protein KJ000_34140 [Pirellulaceae bacterium]|nr:hypothetical protein [Pirellulaceae bacterium]
MPSSRCSVLVRMVILASCIAAAGELSAQPKTPVPDADAQQTAKKAAGELFADRFKQAKTTAEKTALATDMMDAAGKVQAGSADQYVLLKIALAVAAGTGDAALKAAAIKDLRGADSADEQAAIGDAWWDVAETKQGEERDTLRLRAGFWYRQAEPKLAGGLVGLKVKQRLAELEKLEREVPAAPSDATVHRGADPRQQLLQGAVLLMTFEPDTFTPRDGQVVVADLSGCGNHGIVEAAKLIPAGQAGAALQFEGKASVVLPTLANQLAQRLRQLSVSCWVLPADLKGDSIVLDVGFVANASITLYRNDDKFRFSLCEIACESEGLRPRTWYHVVAVWNGIEQRLYVDGVLAAKIPNDRLVLDATTIAVDHGARLGTQAKSASRAGRYFQGLIDEVAIFNRALSEDEIQLLFQLGKRGEPLAKSARTRLGR